MLISRRQAPPSVIGANLAPAFSRFRCSELISREPGHRSTLPSVPPAASALTDGDVEVMLPNGTMVRTGQSVTLGHRVESWRRCLDDPHSTGARVWLASGVTDMRHRIDGGEMGECAARNHQNETLFSYVGPDSRGLASHSLP